MRAINLESGENHGHAGLNWAAPPLFLRDVEEWRALRPFMNGYCKGDKYAYCFGSRIEDLCPRTCCGPSQGGIRQSDPQMATVHQSDGRCADRGTEQPNQGSERRD